MRYILNAHATLWTVNEYGATCFSVKCNTEVKFLANGYFLYNVDTVTLETCLPGLFRNQSLSAHVLCYLLHFCGCVHDMNSSLKVVLSEVAHSTAAT